MSRKHTLNSVPAGHCPPDHCFVSSSVFIKGVTALHSSHCWLQANRYFQTPHPSHTLLFLCKLLKLDPFMGMYKRGFHEQAGGSGRHSCCSVEVADIAPWPFHPIKFTLLCCPLICAFLSTNMVTVKRGDLIHILFNISLHPKGKKRREEEEFEGLGCFYWLFISFVSHKVSAAQENIFTIYTVLLKSTKRIQQVKEALVDPVLV